MGDSGFLVNSKQEIIVSLVDIPRLSSLCIPATGLAIFEVASRYPVEINCVMVSAQSQQIHISKKC